MKANSKVPQLASRLVEGRVRRYNVGLGLQGQKVDGATVTVYIREDLIGRLRKNPQLASFAIPVSEFEQYGKTTLGRAYISSYRWRRCNLQSIFE